MIYYCIIFGNFGYFTNTGCFKYVKYTQHKNFQIHTYICIYIVHIYALYLNQISKISIDNVE